jgi:Kef-type K+ transport system membrane component KefB
VLPDDFLPGVTSGVIVIGLLAWLGYLGARAVNRFKLPAVTGFLVMGILLGPSGLNLLSEETLESLSFVEPMALGIIVFLIGEELTGRMLRRHPWQFWLTSALNILLPTVLVGYAVFRYLPDEPTLAWVLGIIAMSGAPATIMAVIAEKRARGGMCDTVLGCAALDNIACVVAFAVAVPILQLATGMTTSAAEAGVEIARELLGAVVLGAAAGAFMAWLLKRVSDRGEILAVTLIHIVLVVAIAEAIGVSELLAPLVAGVTLATFEERRQTRRPVFESLRSVEFVVYILFFTIAGASLNLSAVVAGGVLVVIYIVARAVGKIGAGFLGGLTQSMTPSESVWLGLGMLPQAGVAVGLGLAAAQAFPEVGATINAVVLAAVVVFELTGPLATQQAIQRVATCEYVPAEGERDVVPEKATVLVPVSYAFSTERLLFLLHMTSAGRPNARFVLTHIVTHTRPITRQSAMRKGRDILEDLEAAAEEAGYEVETRLVEAASVGPALSALARQLDAELVVIGSGQERRFLRRSLLKGPMHKILDEVSAPVLVVPERFESHDESGENGESEPVLVPISDPDADAVSLEEPEDTVAP